ncbi:hypothetical protein ACH42_16080 [Endozoicomonas sp. (ex Bugula neritina AB1)]|nr:hypothetical protein ACH42_16080 [Endozoicomonas sp. (ex Bugula neritina AB1)]
MKVLHVVASCGMYGKERVVLELMREHRKAGITSILGSIRLPDEPAKEMESIAEAEGLCVQSFLLKRGLDFQGARKIIAYAKKTNVDIIHVHDYKGSILLGLLKRWYLMPPLIRTLHGSTATNTWSKIALYEWLEQLSLRFYQSVIGVSENMNELVPFPIKIIQNGISPFAKKRIRGHQDIHAFCAEGVIIGSISRLSQEKNQLALINALDLLVKRGVNAKLLLIGEGEKRNSLEEKVLHLGLSDRVIMPGFVTNARQFLQLMSLYVQPSFREGTPLSILEAMNAKVPLCMSPVGAMNTLLSRGAGYLIPIDAEGMADALFSFINSDENNDSMINTAHQIFTQEYSSAVMAQAYLDEYQKLK